MSSRGHIENMVLLLSVWTDWRKQYWMGYWLLFTWWRIQVELLWCNLFFWRLDSASIFVCCSELPVGIVFGEACFCSHWFLRDSTTISSQISIEQKPLFFKDADLMTVFSFNFFHYLTLNHMLSFIWFYKFTMYLFQPGGCPSEVQRIVSSSARSR